MKVSTIISLMCFAFMSCTFEVDMFLELNRQETKSNIGFSPLSIFQTMSFLANGANGQTKEELLAMVDFNNVYFANNHNEDYLKAMKKNSKLQIHNSIMTKFNCNENFVSRAQSLNIQIGQLFTADHVNKWAAQQTDKRITYVIDKVEELTNQIAIINLFDYRLKWKHQFNSYATKKGIFHSNKKDQEVQLMSTVIEANYYENWKVKMIEVPLAVDDFYVLIIYPQVDFDSYLEDFNQKTIDYQGFYKKKKFVHLTLPKFNLTYAKEMNQVYKQQGLAEAFDEDVADFGGITEHMRMFISDIRHAIYLSVDESGVEPPQTFTEKQLESPKDEDQWPIMNIDKPFLFFIRHKSITHTNILMSKIVNIE